MKKFKTHIIIAVSLIVLLAIGRYAHNSQISAQGEKKQLEKELEELKTQIFKAEENTKKLVDSLETDNAKKDEKIAELNRSNIELLKKQVLREEQLIKDLEKIAKYTYAQSAKAFREQYNTEAVKATAISVNLEEDIPNKVLADLAEKEVCEQNSVDKDRIIENKDSQIKEEQGKTLNANLKTASIEAEKNLLKEALNTSEEFSKKLNKQVKNLKVKNTVNQVLTVGVVVGTILIAK